MYLRSTVLVLVSCLLSMVASGQTPPVQDIEMRMIKSTTLDLGYGNCQWLYPLEAPKEKLAAQPSYKSKTPVYYVAKYGDSKDNVFTFVIDESGGTGKGYDTLYVDGNNDNRIDADRERFRFRMSSVSRDDPIRLTIQVRAGGRTMPYRFNFTAFPYSDAKHRTGKIHANLRNSSYRTGEAVFDGKLSKIAIADLNSNGLFNDVEMGLFHGDRVFVDANGNGSFKDDKDAGGSTGFAYAKYTKIGGRWYSITASPDGARLKIATATPPLGTVKAPPVIASAALQSKTQPCSLVFRRGLARGVAGVYQVRFIALKTTDAGGRTWQTRASFPKDARPTVTISENKTTQLKVGGPPFRIEPTISRKADTDALEISLRIVGTAGERHDWSNGNSRGVKPGVEVRDESSRAVVSATFEYG